MDLDLAEFALDFVSKKGVSYAEVRLENTNSNSFLLKNSVPQIAGFEETTGLGMRFILNKTLGFVSANDISKENIKKLIDKAILTTKAAGKLRDETYLAKGTKNQKNYSVKEKIKAADLEPERKLKILNDIDKAIMSTKINAIGRYLSMGDTLTKKYYVDTEGSRIYSEIPRVNFFYFLTIEEKAQTIQRFWQYGAASGYESVYAWKLPELLANEAKMMRKNLVEGIACPKEKLDVVVAPQVTGIMVHESAGHPYEADRIFGREGAQAGESFISKEMIGTQIGSEIVNVVDDSTLPNSFGFFLFDDEGVKGGKKWLIKNGKINDFMYNRETAYAMGVKSNGAARATNFDRETIVRMSNTFMLPGDHKEEELFEGVKKGIFMKNFMEWNIDDKRLNQKYVGSECYLIENGKITKPVKKPAIEIKTTELYKKIDAIADNTEYHAGTCGKAEPMQAIPVWFGGPSFRLRNMRLC